MIDAENRRNEDTDHGILPLRTGYQTRRPDPRNAPSLTPAQQRANWWHYHWYYVVLIAAALLAVGYFVWNRVTEVQPDYAVAVVSRTDQTLPFSASWRPSWKPLPGT